MPAVSKKQQKFFGIVRAIQKGEMAPTTPETAKAAADMKKGDVKKFASTKHKGLPEKKKIAEDRQIKKIIKQLRKSVKAHDKQADTLEKKVKTFKESNFTNITIGNKIGQTFQHVSGATVTIDNTMSNSSDQQQFVSIAGDSVPAPTGNELGIAGVTMPLGNKKLKKRIADQSISQINSRLDVSSATSGAPTARVSATPNQAGFGGGQGNKTNRRGTAFNKDGTINLGGKAANMSYKVDVINAVTAITLRYNKLRAPLYAAIEAKRAGPGVYDKLEALNNADAKEQQAVIDAWNEYNTPEPEKEPEKSESSDDENTESEYKVPPLSQLTSNIKPPDNLPKPGEPGWTYEEYMAMLDAIAAQAASAEEPITKAIISYGPTGHRTGDVPIGLIDAREAIVIARNNAEQVVHNAWEAYNKSFLPPEGGGGEEDSIPTGFARVAGGFVDALTGNRTDFDKRGGEPRQRPGTQPKSRRSNYTKDQIDFNRKNFTPADIPILGSAHSFATGGGEAKYVLDQANQIVDNANKNNNGVIKPGSKGSEQNPINTGLSFQTKKEWFKNITPNQNIISQIEVKSASNPFNPFGAPQGVMGVKAVHSQISTLSKGVQLDGHGGINVNDTYAFRPDGYENHRIKGIPVTQTYANIVGALGGDKQLATQNFATTLDANFLNLVMKTPGRNDPIVYIKTNYSKRELIKIWGKEKYEKVMKKLKSELNVNESKLSFELIQQFREESNPRIPRKKGQPANSKKHSDLYTDENPKGTIHGLGFKNVAKAKASVSKIRNSSRSHAHKIQAAVAMEQRAREMGKTSEAAVYRKYINSMKKKTKKMNEAANPAQQAAIAISMKKKGIKPKNLKEQISFPVMQQRIRVAKEKRREQQKKSEKLYMDTKRKGVKFYDKKGTGRLKDGKKVYD